MRRTRRIVLLGILLSQALVLQLVESMLPSLAVAPWLKLGLANIITLVTITIFGFWEVIIIVFLRTALGALLRGALGFFIFSFAGALLSGIMMYFMYKYYLHLFSIKTISIVGAIVFNLSQLVVAVIITEQKGLFIYFPLLLVVSVIAGYLVGTTSEIMIGILEKNKKYFL